MSDDLLRDDLDDWLTGEGDLSWDEEPRPPERPEDASWLLRAIAKAERDATAIRALATAERQRIAAWEDDRLAGPARVVQRAERQLAAWALGQNRENPKAKTWVLPNGTLRLRAATAKIVIDDQSALVAWLRKEYPMLVEDVPKVHAADVKKLGTPKVMSSAETEGAGELELSYLVLDDGEVVPGCHLERTVDPTFSYDPSPPPRR
jgi:Gam-like protein